MEKYNYFIIQFENDYFSQNYPHVLKGISFIFGVSIFPIKTFELEKRWKFNEKNILKKVKIQEKLCDKMKFIEIFMFIDF